jgi:uncharacterized protein (UPF0276 family)
MSAGGSAAVSGIGLGLRAPLADAILSQAPPALRWLEVSPENYMARGGAFVRHLDALMERFPIVTHGLTLCPGALEPLDDAYLSTLSKFVNHVQSPWHSDHLCFGSHDGRFLHDLLPLPFTHSAAEHTADRLIEAQKRLDVLLAIENISWYAHPGEPEIGEAAFISEVLMRSGVGLLLDVNNVYVNARNHGFDARELIDALPLDRVVQIHVAGHLVCDDGQRIDTHGEPVCDDVYELLAHTLQRTGPVPVLLERDQSFPTWERVVEEIERLDALWQRAAGGPR